MKPDAIKEAFNRIDQGLAALQALSVLLLDGRHTQTEMQEIGQLTAFMESALRDRVDVVLDAFQRDVLPFYRDFQQAREAMRVTAGA